MDDVEEQPQKYVTVLYHHVSYQNGEAGAIGHHDGENMKCTLVPEVPTDNCDVPDYLPISVISMVVFVPLGIFAVMNSLKVRKASDLHDTATALHFSSWAIQHALTAMVTGPLVFLFIFLYVYILNLNP